MKISIHPLFFGVIIFCAFFGGFFVSIICVLTALLHECGHIFCAARLGYECKSIKLMPYGAAAVCDIEGIRWRDEVALALAGPAVNAAICVSVAALWWFFPDTYAFTDTIMFASLAMLLFNLLPAYPLDGGRVAKCALAAAFSERTAAIILRALNVAFAAALVALFFVSGYNLTFLFFALFMLASAFEKSCPAVRINFASRAALRRGMEIKTVLVSRELTVKGALRLLDGRHYLVLRSEDGRELSQDELYEIMAEKTIYDGVFENVNPFEADGAEDGGAQIEEGPS